MQGPSRDQRVGEGLLRPEGGRPAIRTIRGWCGCAQRILELGGIQAANSYVKVNLSLFDLYPRQYCPSIPPEVVLLPFDLLYQMSSWTRAIVVSLAIVHAANPCRPVPAGFKLDEIWLPGVSPAFRRDSACSPGATSSCVDRCAQMVGAQRVRRPPPRKPSRRPRVDDGAAAAIPTVWARFIRR